VSKQGPTGKPTNKMPAVSVSRVERLLNLLSKTQWDDRAQWVKIATALKNESAGDDCKAVFMRFSRISHKFEQQGAEALWATVARPDHTGPKVTMGTIHKWAAEDDPVGYSEYRASEIIVS
jgi:hypothetical protein